MIISSWNNNITLGTYEILITQQMIATSVANAGKEETQEVIPHIVQVIHAAGIKLILKIMKYNEVLLLAEH